MKRVRERSLGSVSRGCRLGSRRIVRGRVPLHAPAVHGNHAGKENGKERDEKKNEAQEMFVGEVAHKCQPCSTSDDTIVK